MHKYTINISRFYLSPGHSSAYGAIFFRRGPGPRRLCFFGLYRTCTAKVRISLLISSGTKRNNAFCKEGKTSLANYE